jgi:predicted nucleic acid-binding protein
VNFQGTHADDGMDNHRGGRCIGGLAQRSLFAKFLESVKHNPSVTILPPTSALFEAGVEIYSRRPDKAWSLTDCISFAAMDQHGLKEALTGDRHFEQAGFSALLGQAD